MPRRKQGALEHEVMATLWSADGALSPEQVRQLLGSDLAYTTVQTILTRLHDKGVVAREQSGRAYAYRPVVDEAGMTARRMHQLLETETEADRDSVLARFVADLSRSEEAALRKALRPDPS